MSNHYNHLSAEERAVVQIETQDGKSMRSIAKRLGRSPSTLSREVARQVAAAYSATDAGRAYRAEQADAGSTPYAGSQADMGS